MGAIEMAGARVGLYVNYDENIINTLPCIAHPARPPVAVFGSTLGGHLESV
jgi:hypothetical protein